MSQFRKPFFRPSRGLWYVEIVRGKQINLGRDRDAAFARYHEMMARTGQAAVEPSAEEPSKSELVVVLVDKFLGWCEKHRAPDTFRWYQDRLQLFCNAIRPTLEVAELKNFHVQEWVDALPQLAAGSKRNHCRSVQRVMRWAVQQGYIASSPIAQLEKPAAGRRESILTEDQYRKLLAATGDEEFRDLLTVSWEVGCRPQESLRVEARHFDRAHARWIFPASEAKGGKLPRVVYLTDRALSITEKLTEKYPNGPIFRNSDGKPWTPDAANCRFQRLAKKTGVRCCLYTFRHTWMNRLLLNGVDALTVAILAGHRDPSTLAKTYQHLSQAPGYLRQQVGKITC